jgi:hypothetical protein
MFCFDTIARHIVGKSCDSLVKFTSGSSKIPPDLAAIVSLKFAFVVTATNRSFDVPEKVFQIESIVVAYGRQQYLPQISQGTQQEPATPPKISTTSYLQDSPSTAIQRLATNTPVKVKVLTHCYLQIFLRFSFFPLCYNDVPNILFVFLHLPYFSAGW